MPQKFKKLKIRQDNVHVGRGVYRKYNQTISTNKIYCTDCFTKYFNQYENSFFKIVKSNSYID